MKTFIKILKWLFIVFLSLFGFVFIICFLFRFLWDSYSVNSLNEARQLLKKHGPTEHQLVVRECKKIIDKGVDVSYFKEEIPDEFKILSPQYVRFFYGSCEVNLYKAPGRGIAYWVSKNKNGQLELSWRDDFISWQPNKIELN